MGIPPCPNCGAVIENAELLPRGQWDYDDLPDGSMVLWLVMPLDPLIEPYLAGRPVAHRCHQTAEQRAAAKALVQEAEAFLRHEAKR